MKIKIGSRGSPLAKIQAAEVSGLLKEKFPELETEFVFIKTSGDRGKQPGAGGKGLFVKEIEEALLRGDVDIAVHSMKDMPAKLPQGLVIGCVPKRADPSDCFVFPASAKREAKLESLKKGAKIGTASLRRKCQILAIRHDVSVEPVRGNIGTRIAKMDSGAFDAIMLASAALARLEIKNRTAQKMLPHDFVPAPGQGALAVERRRDDEKTAVFVKAIDCEESRICVEIERAFLQKLGGNCGMPAGCHSRQNGDKIQTVAFAAPGDGGKIHREIIETDVKNSADAGTEIAEKIISRARRY